MTYLAGQIIRYPKFVNHCILKMQLTVKSNLNVSEEKGFAYIQPCAAEVGKVMLESNLTKLVGTISNKIIDFNVLCNLLNIYKIRFSEAQCSLALGVSRVKWRGKTISIFKKGKIKIREALNNEDAIKMLQDLLRLIWGSITCKICEQPAIYCAAGICNKCLEENVQGEFVNLDELPTGIMLSNALINLSKSSSLLNEIFSNVLNGLHGEKISEIKVKDFERLLNRVDLNTLDFIVQTPNIKQASLGFVPLGITFNLKNVLKTVNSLIKEINQNLEALTRSNVQVKKEISDVFQKIVNLYEFISHVASMKSKVKHDTGEFRITLEDIRRLEEKVKDVSYGLNKFLSNIVKHFNEICLTGLRILNILGGGI